MNSVADLEMNAVTLEFSVPRRDRPRSGKRLLRDLAERRRMAAHADARPKVRRALHEVDFRAQGGDLVGIVGSNGAGKTSLLRVLAGTYEPTGGRVRRRGRVATLTDLNLRGSQDSGHDSIMRQGLLLGLRSADVKGRVAAVATLSGLGDRLWLPTNTYSAGMKIRLAFAIGLCLEPDILLIDDCIGAADRQFMTTVEHRVRQLAGRGKIVVLASHDRDLLQRVCDTGVLLDAGRVMASGPIRDVLKG